MLYEVCRRIIYPNVVKIENDTLYICHQCRFSKNYKIEERYCMEFLIVLLSFAKY